MPPISINFLGSHVEIIINKLYEKQTFILNEIKRALDNDTKLS